MTCPDCHGVCLCHLRGDPAWDRHLAGRAALLRGEPAPPVLVPPAPDPVHHQPDLSPHIGPLDTRREIVIARHREPIAWTAAVPYPVRIYNAGPPVEPPASHVRVIDRPNLGREAGAYLTHIVRRYHRLAELTCFVQADPWDHCECADEFLARLALRYDEPMTLTTRYKAEIPPDSIKAQDRVGEYQGFPIRYGLATAGHVDGAKPGRNWLNRAIWKYIFNCPEPDPWLFGYSACWAVPRAHILSRPLAFWTWLLGQNFQAGTATTSWSDPPLNAWSLEALWLYLFSDPARYPHHPRQPDCGGCGGRA
jgi:hypothetical protein